MPPALRDTPPVPSDEAAWTLLRGHFDGRSSAPCIAAAPLLEVPSVLERDVDLRALAALSIAQSFGLVDPDRERAVCSLIRAALAGDIDRVLEAAQADTVLAWCTAMSEWCERNGLDHEFSRLTPRAAIADAKAEASLWLRVHWRVATAWHHEAFGRRPEVEVLLDQAEAMATDAGNVGLQVAVWLHQARLVLARKAPERAIALARRVQAHASEKDSPLWLADAADVLARAALMQGDMHRALHQSRRANGLASLAQASAPYAMTYRLYESYAMIGLGAYDEALALIEALAAIRPQPLFLVERLQLLARLFALIRDDRSARWPTHSQAELAGVLGRLRELDWPGVLAVLPQWIARLWARALDAGIETDWVRASIRSRDLQPPEPSWPPDWPWAVRVRVLGKFSCVVDGRELVETSPGKAAAKPMALLRRLAVQAGHDGVAAEVLAHALWPGEGREGRDKALETTLARLRRRLGHPDAVLISEKRMRLNPLRVWLDVVALCRELEQLRQSSNSGAGVRDRDRAWDAALALWRGPLLADEGDANWVTEPRDHLRALMAAAIVDDTGHEGHRGRRLRALAADASLRSLL